MDLLAHGLSAHMWFPNSGEAIPPLGMDFRPCRSARAFTVGLEHRVYGQEHPGARSVPVQVRLCRVKRLFVPVLSGTNGPPLNFDHSATPRDDDAQTSPVWQAVGVLIERHHLDRDDALGLLLQQPGKREATVHSVAQAILDELPRTTSQMSQPG